MADRGSPFFRRAVERARREPGFLGAVLAEYQARLGLDDAALAAELGCAEAHLADLALCRPPRAERFRADLEQIAGRLGLDPLPLARVLRLAGALGALADAAPGGEGLRAARRVDETDEPAGEGPPDEADGPAGDGLPDEADGPGREEPPD